MALRSVSQADEFEPSVSMNDQNWRVLSCLESDQSGWMQHLRTGCKVSWNALPAMTKEVAHQNSEARNCPVCQKGSTVVNASRLISQLECSCTFSIAVTWLSLMYLLSCSLPQCVVPPAKNDDWLDKYTALFRERTDDTSHTTQPVPPPTNHP